MVLNPVRDIAQGLPHAFWAVYVSTSGPKRSCASTSVKARWRVQVLYLRIPGQPAIHGTSLTGERCFILPALSTMAGPVGFDCILRGENGVAWSPIITYLCYSHDKADMPGGSPT